MMTAAAIVTAEAERRQQRRNRQRSNLLLPRRLRRNNKMERLRKIRPRRPGVHNRQFPKARRSQREGIERLQPELLILQSVFRAQVLGVTGKDRMDQTVVRKQTLTMATITLTLEILTPMIGLTARGKHQDRSRQKNMLVQTFINSQVGFRITRVPF